MINVDPLELEKFSQLAHRWWDPGAEFKPLHDINPLRLDYIDGIAGLRGKRVLDVGCGGGILAESHGARGATRYRHRPRGEAAQGGPAAPARIRVGGRVPADRLRKRSRARRPASFDVVTCMELLEHVPDPGATVRACAELVKPGGRVFFSTINRNLKSYLLAVLGAEYVLKLLPRGTHDYARFIKPSELAGDVPCRRTGCRGRDRHDLQPHSQRSTPSARMRM